MVLKPKANDTGKLAVSRVLAVLMFIVSILVIITQATTLLD